MIVFVTRLQEWLKRVTILVYAFWKSLLNQVIPLFHLYFSFHYPTSMVVQTSKLFVSESLDRVQLFVSLTAKYIVKVYEKANCWFAFSFLCFFQLCIGSSHLDRSFSCELKEF